MPVLELVNILLLNSLKNIPAPPNADKIPVITLPAKSPSSGVGGQSVSHCRQIGQVVTGGQVVAGGHTVAKQSASVMLILGHTVGFVGNPTVSDSAPIVIVTSGTSSGTIILNVLSELTDCSGSLKIIPW